MSNMAKDEIEIIKQIPGVKCVVGIIRPIKGIEIPATFIVNSNDKTTIGFTYTSLRDINNQYIKYHVAPSIGFKPESITFAMTDTVFSKNDTTPFRDVKVIVHCNEADEFDEAKGVSLAKKKLCKNIRRSLSKTLFDFTINIRKLARKAEDQADNLYYTSIDYKKQKETHDSKPVPVAEPMHVLDDENDDEPMDVMYDDDKPISVFSDEKDDEAKKTHASKTVDVFVDEDEPIMDIILRLRRANKK